MSGGPDNKNTERFTRAAFLCAALVLVLLLLQPLTAAIVASTRPASTPAPSPSAAPEIHTVAFFGDASDPFCAPLYPALEELCKRQGWQLIQYDCRGRAAAQQGQLDDFMRNEVADVAVLYPLAESEELTKQVKALYKCCNVVTVSQQPRTVASRYIAAHVGPAQSGRVDALCDYLDRALSKSKEVLLISDLPDPDISKEYQQEFSKRDVTVLDENYTWGDKIYAERYLETGLELFPQADAIVCASRHGTRGSLNSLRDKSLRSKIKIVALDYTPEMEEDLILGELDAAVTLLPKDAAEQVTELLPKLLNAEQLEERFLAYHVLTPHNIGELDSVS